MDFSQLYVWGPIIGRGYLHVKPVNKGVDIYGLLRGNVVLTEPMKFVRSMGSRLGDIISTELAVIWLVSDRIVELFQREGITGWKTYPVEVTGKGGVPVTGYHGFAVTGRCGPIDPRRSVLKTLPPLVPGGEERRVRLGLYFDMDTWDGSDIFVATNNNRVIVVERVKELLERNNIRGCEFDRLTEVQNHMRVV